MLPLLLEDLLGIPAFEEVAAGAFGRVTGWRSVGMMPGRGSAGKEWQIGCWMVGYAAGGC